MVLSHQLWRASHLLLGCRLNSGACHVQRLYYMQDRKLIKAVCDRWRGKPGFADDLQETDKIISVLYEKWASAYFLPRKMPFGCLGKQTRVLGCHRSLASSRSLAIPWGPLVHVSPYFVSNITCSSALQTPIKWPAVTFPENQWIVCKSCLLSGWLKPVFYKRKKTTFSCFFEFKAL